MKYNIFPQAVDTDADDAVNVVYSAIAKET